MTAFRLHVRTALTLMAIALPTSLRAQALKAIGNTSAGTPVMLETKTVSKADGIVTATLRVGLAPVMKTTNGDMVLLRSVTMIDCKAQTTATKERWFYFDAKATKEARHDKAGKPGFGVAIKGSLADVAITHFCAATK